jgi:thiamine biosynthesis lipoprotein
MLRGILRIAGLLTIAVAAPATPSVREIHYVMGTYYSIAIEHADPAAARAAARRCFADARHLEGLFSRYDPASELSQLNASAERAVEVSEELAALLRRALRLREETGGAFDIAVGRLTELWRTTSVWPSDIEVTRARPWPVPALRLAGRTLRREPGARIDLDGIAKGWAVDRCVAELRRSGMRRALLSFGESSIYALGSPQAPWEVAVRDLPGSGAVGVVRLQDEALSVSAVLGRERTVDGRRIGHIIDPRNGLPLTSPGMVAVVAATATDAEAYSKALLIEECRALAKTWRLAPGAGAVLLTPDGMWLRGRMAFQPYAHLRRIAPSEEPLR